MYNLKYEFLSTKAVLLKEDDQTLKDIVNNIKAKL